MCAIEFDIYWVSVSNIVLKRVPDRWEWCLDAAVRLQLVVFGQQFDCCVAVTVHLHCLVQHAQGCAR